MDDTLFSLLPARRGHFRFESGFHGDLWLELDRLFLHPARLRPLAQALARRLARHDVEVAVGPLTGGAFLAQMVAEELACAFCPSEPAGPPADGRLYSVAYRLPASLRPDLAGRRAAIVDDVISAGSALRGTHHAVIAAGAEPVAAAALLVLGDASAAFLRTNGLALECLAARPSTLWEPAACPLCAAGTPLDN